jgi:hypothetical protein
MLLPGSSGLTHLSMDPQAVMVRFHPLPQSLPGTQYGRPRRAHPGWLVR